MVAVITAGIGGPQQAHELSMELYDKIMDVSLSSTAPRGSG